MYQIPLEVAEDWQRLTYSVCLSWHQVTSDRYVINNTEQIFDGLIFDWNFDLPIFWEGFLANNTFPKSFLHFSGTVD